jgi:peptidoglycan/LPS O-acetylase OafA/YrhL
MADPALTGGRYHTLDAWRGLAALAVLAYHSINTVVAPGRGPITDLLLHGWLGVFVFFPISGYCILAATCSGRNPTPGQFLKRRWLRIFPTYWASIGVAVVVLVITNPFGRAFDQLRAPGWHWLSIATLTQTITGLPNAINPVYWSLCYEEQFYLLVAVTLLLPPRLRPAALLALSAVTSAWRLTVGPAVISGWFVDFWLEFAVGMAVFGWSHPAFGRAWASAVILLSGAVVAWQGQLAPLASTAVAITLLCLRQWDEATARLRPVKILAALGAMSYSLYLIHVPVAGRVVNGLSRLLGPPANYWLLLLIAAGAITIPAAYVFYRVVEVRFISRGQVRLDPAADVTTGDGRRWVAQKDDPVRLW